MTVLDQALNRERWTTSTHQKLEATTHGHLDRGSHTRSP